MQISGCSLICKYILYDYRLLSSETYLISPCPAWYNRYIAVNKHRERSGAKRSDPQESFKPAASGPEKLVGKRKGRTWNYCSRSPPFYFIFKEREQRMVKAKTEAQNAVASQTGQATTTEVLPGSSSATARTSLHRVVRNPGSATGGLSPLSACILRLAELGRQRLAREAQAMAEKVGDELPANTHENLD